MAETQKPILHKTKNADTDTSMPHKLQLDERSALRVSGVSDVDSFDDNTVVLYTARGELSVQGEKLHIQRLDVETGDLCVEGQIRSLSYSDEHPRRGFFGRLFK